METGIPGGSLTFLAIYLMGLGLNLTPCVYPMMFVTVSLFGSREEKHQAIAFLKALVYVLGMAVMYSSLGLIAAATGGVLGMMLQNQWVLLGIGFLLFLLSLSMFGVYTFQAPGWLLSRLGGVKRTTYIGIFFSGMMVGIFAAPCVGPPIVALLTFVGTRSDPVLGFWIFFVMSLGLGTPYLFLGTFSGLIRKLPKSGMWMVTIEHLFGVLLLALACFYITLALHPPFMKLVLPGALIFGGFYLGFLDSEKGEAEKFSRFKKAAGTLAILAGMFIPLLSPAEGVVWTKYSPQLLTAAQAAKKPVVMDFYADWCIPCHELDQFTYTDKRVISKLSKFERFKVNLTEMDSPETAEVLERFNVLGVPTILFLDPSGVEIKKARIVGFVDADDFLDNLDKYVL